MSKKKDLADLALFGGTPAFSRPLHVGRPNVGEMGPLLGRIRQVLASGWLTNNGPQVQQFERRIAERVGVGHCVATCNATVALQIAIKTAGLSGEVLVPALTFVATAHALKWLGITPVFCDVDPATGTLDPKSARQRISARTTGIIGVHLWGRPCDVQGLREVASEYDLKLLFDAAHAFGCSHRGRMVGAFGDAEVFSFHATKVLNTFEGGAIVTDDPAFAAKCRSLVNFGFGTDHQTIYVGTNGKMSEIAAAMGLSGLECMDRFVAANRRSYLGYLEQFRQVRGVHLLPHDESERCNYHYNVVRLDAEVAGIERDDLMRVLHAENVMAQRYFYPPCHEMAPYRTGAASRVDLPSTQALARSVLVLPAGESVGPRDVARIGEVVRLAVDRATEVRSLLERHEPKARRSRSRVAARPGEPGRPDDLSAAHREARRTRSSAARGAPPSAAKRS